ncbi:MAG: sigma-70 family RNA polymerase sigma factor [Myxococcota bacterium]
MSALASTVSMNGSGPGQRAPDVQELYRTYGRAVYRRCLYFLRNEDDARDAMHEVFLKIVERYGEFRGDASPLTWAIRIATNHCLNVIRSRRAGWRDRYERTAVQEADLSQPDGRHVWKSDLVRELLARVPDDIRAAAIYYFVDEMTQEEAAAACGCSVPTLRKKLRRFIDIARKHIRREDADVVFGDAPL